MVAQLTPAPQPAGESASGIDVREEELGTVTAQRVYKMRCECGRSWFELDVPTLIKCPACAKLCLVSL
ncbi:MAG: hypothetical protein ABSF96_00935 [Steroidobacteraceae bacterium]